MLNLNAMLAWAEDEKGTASQSSPSATLNAEYQKTVQNYWLDPTSHSEAIMKQKVRTKVITVMKLLVNDSVSAKRDTKRMHCVFLMKRIKGGATGPPWCVTLRFSLAPSCTTEYQTEMIVHLTINVARKHRTTSRLAALTSECHCLCSACQ